MMIKPKRLTKGSKIAIVSPSSGLPSILPDIYELGLKNLEEIFGFEIVEMPSARMTIDELYQNPRLRAEDLNRCFADESIDGIISSIGGYESIRILPYLDTEVILNNPKFIMGFSDASTFLCYLNQLGLVTFYGPSVMAGFAQLNHLPPSYKEHLLSFIITGAFPYTYKPYAHWADGYKDWSIMETLGQCTELKESKGWNLLQGTQTEGVLWGGCIEVLEFLKSTDYWPEKGFWKDKILFFETSEEKPSPDRVGYMLRNYGMQGILNEINGIIFGRAKDYSAEEKEKLNETIRSIIQTEFNQPNLTIVTDFDFGHTEPKLILTLGGKVRINPSTKEITLLESPYR